MAIISKKHYDHPDECLFKVFIVRLRFQGQVARYFVTFYTNGGVRFLGDRVMREVHPVSHFNLTGGV